MTYLNPKDIIVDFLRSKLVDPRARAESTQTELFDGGGKEFELDPDVGSAQAITSVKVGTTTQVKWKDYYIDHQNEKVIFFSNTSSGTNNVEIIYKYGSTNWIYPDKPKETLSAISFPRLNIISIGGTGSRLGQYNSDIESTHNFQIDIWTKEDQVFTIGDNKYSGDRLGDYIAHQITKYLQTSIDELHPAFYNLTLTSMPRDLGFDSELQCYHKVLEIELKGINVGESYA